MDRQPSHPFAWLRAAALLSALLAPMAASQAQVANIVQDNFTGDQASNPWVAIGGACLTAGDSNTTVSSAGIGIPACVGHDYYKAWPSGTNKPAGYNPTNQNSQLPLVGLPSSGTQPDAVGSGALRLTNGGGQSTNESGAIISTVPFSANQGIQVTFTTYTYGGNSYYTSSDGGVNPGADGIGFYLIDASQYASGSSYLSSNGSFAQGDLGAFGGSLGYSCSNTNSPYNGMIGGYIGLGIDEYGNFLNRNDNTNSGQTLTTANEGHQNPGEFGLRGPGNVSWAWLSANYPQYYPSSLSTSTAETAVQNTCKTGTLWDYNTASTTSPQAVQTTTAYDSCTTVQVSATSYADLTAQYGSDYYPPVQSKNDSSGPSSYFAQRGLNDTCTGSPSYLYKYQYYSGKGHWTPTSTRVTCSTTSSTGYSVGYADLSSAYPNYYPSSLSTALQTQAVQYTCTSGYVWDYSQYALPSSPYDTGTAIPDYSVIPASVVTLPSDKSISNESATSRSQATAITYKVIVTSNGLLSFYYDYGNAVDSTTGQLQFKQVMNQVPISDSSGTPPTSYLFGFGGSTGGGTNVHEITCFEATPAARTIGSPVAPLTVTSGSLLYTLTSNPSPIAGYVDAYSLDANGTPASSATWEAGKLMSDGNRSQYLYSTAADGSAVVSLSSLDTTAFALSTPSTCVPDTATIVSYTVDPNVSYSPTPAGCTAPYLGSRQVGWLLDQFSAGDYAALLMPPHDPSLLSLSGYSAYAVKEAGRPAALLFTNDDGFLYSIDAAKGTLNWGWMPRSFVSQLQNYTSWPYQDNFAGKFAVVDASTTSTSTSGTQTTTWGTYVVGSAQGGALWYDLALDSNGAPSKVVATFAAPQTPTPSNTTALPSGSLSYPQRQAPTVASIGGSQYGAFVVNATSSGATATTLYEFNVATGASTSAAIPATTTGIGSGNYVTSNVFYDPNSGVLFFGTSDGKVYSMSFTGSATTDVGNIASLGSTEDLKAVQFVGYQELGSQPYLWATSSDTITVFGINNSGWSPLWASAPGKAYSYGSGTWSPVTAASSSGSSSGGSTSASQPTSLQASATITDLPVVVDGVLVVPAYVPPSAGAQACNIQGEGYYDFFSLNNGAFPTTPITHYVLVKGTLTSETVTTDLSLGEGKPYSPSISLSGTALPAYGSTEQTQTPGSPLLFSRAGLNTVVQWRIH